MFFFAPTGYPVSEVMKHLGKVSESPGLAHVWTKTLNPPDLTESHRSYMPRCGCQEGGFVAIVPLPRVRLDERIEFFFIDFPQKRWVDIDQIIEHNIVEHVFVVFFVRFAAYWYPQITYHYCTVSNQDMKAFPRIKISSFNHLFSGVIFVSNRVIWSPTIPDITPSIPLIYGWYCWWRKSCTTWDARNLVNKGINYLSTGAGFLPSTVCHTVES